MLRAVFHRKTRLYRRYLGHRVEGERNVREEDEITSSLFEGLALLSPSDICAFWRKLVEEGFSARFFPKGGAAFVEWTFWPRRGGRNFVEPDMLIVFRWGDGCVRILLVELKWGSGVGEGQLQRQWNEFLTPAERAVAAHVLIARDVTAGLVAKESRDVWRCQDGSRLSLLPWMRVRDAVVSLCEASGSLGVWAELADRFLEALQVAAFQGFQRTMGFFPRCCDSRPIIWRGASFLSALSPSSELVFPIDSPGQAEQIFWRPGTLNGWPLPPLRIPMLNDKSFLFGSEGSDRV